MLLNQIQKMVQNALFRSALRFAITIVVVDVVVLAIFGSGTAAMMGSIAVAVHLYFLDFDGDAKERFTGQGIATLIGTVAVALGVLCAGNLWVALASAFIVSSAFAYFRLLRGYVARSAVGLPAAFFLPLMVPAQSSDMVPFLGAWLVGSSVSIVSALVLLPHRRTGIVRSAVAAWLQAAGELSLAVALRKPLQPAIDQLRSCRDALLVQVTGSYSRPGAVSRKQRALASMVAGARWSMPVAEKVLPPHQSDPSTLAAESAEGFFAAAELVRGRVVPRLPDLPSERVRDLDSLVGQKPDVVRAHYPTRLLSIVAMNMLFRAAQTRGRVAPTPDVGALTDERPIAILRANFRWKSLWLHNALRTGAGAATCVFIVRMIGLEHGLWVILAALSVTQVTFSAVSGSKTLFKIVAGAVAGVLLASLIILFQVPYVVFVIALPFLAFAAKRLQYSDIFFAQLAYTPFALVNLSVLEWPPKKGIELLRVEDILLGAAVAAGFTLLVFPLGINKLVSQLQLTALESSRSYLHSALTLVREGKKSPGISREKCERDIQAYEDALDAAFMSTRVETAQLTKHEFASALTRDYFLGGDTCAELFAHTEGNPEFVPVAQELSLWWEEFLSQENTLSSRQG